MCLEFRYARLYRRLYPSNLCLTDVTVCCWHQSLPREGGDQVDHQSGGLSTLTDFVLGHYHLLSILIPLVRRNSARVYDLAHSELVTQTYKNVVRHFIFCKTARSESSNHIDQRTHRTSRPIPLRDAKTE